MKSQKEIDDLKRNWRLDPCWTLHKTEGFEEHTEELRLYEELMDKKWREDWHERILQKAITMHCAFETAEYINALEHRIERLEER